MFLFSSPLPPRSHGVFLSGLACQHYSLLILLTSLTVVRLHRAPEPFQSLLTPAFPVSDERKRSDFPPGCYKGSFYPFCHRGFCLKQRGSLLLGCVSVLGAPRELRALRGLGHRGWVCACCLICRVPRLKLMALSGSSCLWVARCLPATGGAGTVGSRITSTVYSLEKACCGAIKRLSLGERSLMTGNGASRRIFSSVAVSNPSFTL